MANNIIIPEVGETPNQPRDFNFPKLDFGQTNPVFRSFQSSWFLKWGWLHYDAASDVAFCHICIRALKSGKMLMTTGNTRDSSFAVGGFCNWKDGTIACSKHESSATHKLGVVVIFTLPATNHDVTSLQRQNIENSSV